MENSGKIDKFYKKSMQNFNVYIYIFLVPTRICKPGLSGMLGDGPIFCLLFSLRTDFG